jgi:hypothetical protein
VDRPVGELRVAAAGGGRVLRIGGVGPGMSVELRYGHSVERTPIVEVYRVEPDGLWFVEMRFVSQGAGLPTEGYVREGGQFVLRRRRHVGVLSLRLSAIAGHRLRVGDQEIDLVRAFADGQAVTIAPGRVVRLRWPGVGRGTVWYNPSDSARPPRPKRQAPAPWTHQVTQSS